MVMVTFITFVVYLIADCKGNYEIWSEAVALRTLLSFLAENVEKM